MYTRHIHLLIVVDVVVFSFFFVYVLPLPPLFVFFYYISFSFGPLHTRQSLTIYPFFILILCFFLVYIFFVFVFEETFKILHCYILVYSLYFSTISHKSTFICKIKKENETRTFHVAHKSSQFSNF